MKKAEGRREKAEVSQSEGRSKIMTDAMLLFFFLLFTAEFCDLFFTFCLLPVGLFLP